MKTDASEELLSALDKIRMQALSELQRYYTTEMELIDFSARLGNVMTICHAVRVRMNLVWETGHPFFQESNTHFQEYFRTHAALFDVHTADNLMQELFL